MDLTRDKNLTTVEIINYGAEFYVFNAQLIEMGDKDDII